jgi:hypothetical protein
MGMKKIIRDLEGYIDNKVDESYANGYSDGIMDSGTDYDTGFAEGVSAEKERVQLVLKTIADNDLKVGRGTKAKTYLDLAELLAFTYDPDGAVEEDF